MEIQEIRNRQVETEKYQSSPVTGTPPKVQNYRPETVDKEKDTVSTVKEKKEYAEEIIIGNILLEAGKSDMGMEKLQQKLAEKGHKTDVVVIDGRKELRFLDSSGNVTRSFRDTSGDGGLGMDDKEFRNAIKDLKDQFPGAQQLEFLHANKKAKRAQEKAAALEGYQQMLGVGEGGEAAEIEGIEKDQEVMQLLNVVQFQLDAKNYQGPSALVLWQTGELTRVAAELGIYVPENLPSPPAPDPNSVARDLFRMAVIPFRT